jgi:acyl-CoA thioester hydrolase
MEEHKLPIRIYFEDTDAGGVVYYANYLKFAERARSECCREKGYSHALDFKNSNHCFVVRHCEAEYLSPARLDDLVDVYTKFTAIKNASTIMEQRICLGEKELVKIKTAMVYVNEEFKPTRIPDEIRNKL